VTAFTKTGMTLLSLWIAGTVAVGLRGLVQVVSGSSLRQIRTVWVSSAPVGYAALAVALLLTLARKPERSLRNDIGVLAVMFGPLFFLHVLIPGFSSSSDSTWLLQCDWYTSAFTLAVGFIITPLLSLYRRLPWST
jgi:hypothetical protein